MLCSSFSFGIRQSLYPANPTPFSAFTWATQSHIVRLTAEDQANVRKASWRLPSLLLFFSHMSCVFRSVMVPSPLSWNLSAPPARTAPSSFTGAPVVVDVLGAYDVVCPVAGNAFAHVSASTAVAHTATPNGSTRLLARTRARTRRVVVDIDAPFCHHFFRSTITFRSKAGLGYRVIGGFGLEEIPERS